MQMIVNTTIIVRKRSQPLFVKRKTLCESYTQYACVASIIYCLVTARTPVIFSLISICFPYNSWLRYVSIVFNRVQIVTVLKE